MGHSEDDAVYKILHKIKTLWQNQLKISVYYRFYSKFSIELDIKRYLANAPLILPNSYLININF